MNTLKINFNAETEPAIAQDHPTSFALALAHEVRNPLANIDLSVEILERGITDEHLRNYLDIIRRSSKRINDLTKELLKSQQTEELPLEPYSMHLLLDEVLETTIDRIAPKHVWVIKEYMAQYCLILSNREKMKIALTNIVINAIDAMASGEGRLKLVTDLSDGRFSIRIEDNGCGISKEDLKNIFKPSFTKKTGGLGLGLATTYDIFRSKNIGLTVESVLGTGTKFIILFQQHHLHNLPHL